MVINLCWLRKAVGNVPSSKVLAERHPSESIPTTAASVGVGNFS